MAWVVAASGWVWPAGHFGVRLWWPERGWEEPLSPAEAMGPRQMLGAPSCACFLEAAAAVLKLLVQTGKRLKGRLLLEGWLLEWAAAVGAAVAK